MTTAKPQPAKPKLLVILGAGSSVGLGFPTVDALDKRMRDWAAAWSQRLGWTNVYQKLETAARCYAQAGQAAPRPAVTFETVLGDMAHLAHWLTPPPLGASLRRTVGDIEGLPFPFPEPNGYGPAHLIQDQLCHLLTELARDLRQRSRDIDLEGPKIGAYRRLFDGLRAEFDVGVFNLNYDAAALTVLPKAVTGFVGADFAPKQVHARQDWGFIYHLHGSVHHDLVDPNSARLIWREDLGGEFNDGGQSLLGEERSEGRTFPRSTLIAGGSKLDQLLAEPFHSLHAALVRRAYDADAIFIGGYGFADVHVNRALRNRMSGLAAEERPPVMVLDFANDKTKAMPGRQDAWSRNLDRTLLAPVFDFRDLRHGGWAKPLDLAKAGGFEISTINRTAIWHGGFLEAADHVTRITRWLAGASGALA